MKRLVKVGLLTLVAVAVGLTPAYSAEVTTYSPSRIQWTKLEYRASKLGIKANSDVYIELVPATEAAKSFVEPEGGRGLMPDEDMVAHVKLHSFVRGKESQVELWLDPSSASALQRLSVERSAKRNVYRNYRFRENSAHAVRREPASNKDNQGDAAKWPLDHEIDIPFPSNLSDRAVSEASALFYVLAAADFREAGDKVILYGFDRDGMTQLVMTFVEMQEMKVDYTEVSSAGERTVRDRRQVARVTLSGEAVEPGSTFEFLGLQGDIEIFVDPELRVPVEVVGRIPYAGRTRVGLSTVTIK